MIDKKSIHKIEDGQRGSEIAENMKSNFDMLADAINANESSISDIGKSSFKKAIVIKVDESSKGFRGKRDTYKLSHTQEEINKYVTQIIEDPNGTDVFAIFDDGFIKMNVVSVDTDFMTAAFTACLQDGVIIELYLAYEEKESCCFDCVFGYNGMDELSNLFFSFIESELGVKMHRENIYNNSSSDYSFEITANIAGENTSCILELREARDLFKSLLVYAKHNHLDTHLTNSYFGEKCIFIPCDIGDSVGDVTLTRAFCQSSARFIRLSKDIIFVDDMFRTFAECKDLEAIEGEMYLRENCDIAMAFSFCKNLQYFCISNLNADFDISDSPMVKPCCILHLIRNADKNKTIKIKVHKSIYDAINGTSEEWQSVRDALSGGGI